MEEMNARDAAKSQTGVFYQAMPAIGDDGKKIMKLIPVQMMNGQFYQTQIIKPKTVPTPQTAALSKTAPVPVQIVHKAVLNPSVTHQVVRKQVSLVKALPNNVCLNVRSSLNQHPPQPEPVGVMTKLLQMAALTTASKPGGLPSQQSVMVKSDALLRGQKLQTPPNGQNQTIPASQLPPSKEVVTSPISSSPASAAARVVYMSIKPVDQGVSPPTVKQGVCPPAVNQGATLPANSARHFHTLPPKTSNETSCGPPSVRPKRKLKLIPTDSQRPNSPIKWVVEEEESSPALVLDPLPSPSVTTEILSTVAEREKAGKQRCDTITNPLSKLSQGRNGRQEDAIVMCNGKMFHVAKRSGPPPETVQRDSSVAVRKTSGFKKVTVPSPQKPLESAAPERRKDIIVVIPNRSNVIDLCDDDDQDESSQQATSVDASAARHLDEDKVIFVSYAPPKSDSGSAQDLILKTQTALMTETQQTDTSSSNRWTTQKQLDGPMDGRSVLGGRKSDQSFSTQKVESMDGEKGSPENPGPSDGSSGERSQMQNHTHKLESSMNSGTSVTSLLTPKSCQMADHALRQMFGIPADVQVCLQRIDEASDGSIMSVDDHQEGSHPRCSHIKLNIRPPAFRCHSGPRLIKAEPVSSYMQPIDDSFLSTHEHDVHGPQTANCLDLNTSTRRIGRARKRKFCPCCTPGSLDHAVKFNSKSAEAEKWSWRKAQVSRRGRRAKAVRRSVNPLRWNSCLTAQRRQNSQTHEVPSSDSLYTTVVNLDELNHQEQIEKLKELLREKEAALELMRSRMRSDETYFKL